MRLTYFLSIILILILRIGIRAEPTSLSFVNLISDIISNGQFIQENFIDSNINFDQTSPSLNIDESFEANSSNCSQDVRIFVRDLAAGRAWALKTIDAWGKRPSGIMQGNIFWVGSPFECGHHLRSFNNTVIEQPFPTRTCVIKGTNSKRILPVYGICVPKSCSANEIVQQINQRIIQIPFVKRVFNLTNDSISCIDNRPFDTKAIATILLLTLIVILVFLATGMHIIYGHKHDLTMTDTPPTGYQPIVSQTTITTSDESAPIISEQSTQSETVIRQSDESTPLVSRPRRSVDSVATSLISCCSLLNNYHILINDRQPKSLAFLNGIRVLSLQWIILGHTFLMAAYYSDNVLAIFNWTRNLFFQIIIQAIFGIDSFFVLSGLLTAFIFFITKLENERFSIGRFLLNHYVYRYLRYTIFYAIILLIYITLSPYFGQDGPIYPTDGIESVKCRRTWWRNLLYINNFFDLRDSCMPFTWFLAANMQFHWVAPLFLFAASWKWIIGMLVAICFILVDIITTSVIVSKRNYEHGIFGHYFSNTSNWSNTTHDYMNDVYVKPWCRIAPYAIGLLIGYTLYEMYQRSNELSWNSVLPRRNSPRINQIKRIVVWIIAFVIFGLIVFGTYGDYSGKFLTRSGRIAFLTLSRIGWGVGLNMIIFACFMTRGGIANLILNHSFFEPLAKLTYGAFLWHVFVICVNYFSRDQPTHYTLVNVLINATIHIIVSYILSFFTFLFIELPIIQLLKMVFKRPTIRSN